jgi:5-methylcytosine-specific restriction endonuclease McrA
MFIRAYSIFVLARKRTGDQGRDTSGCRCYGCTGRYPGLLVRTADTESPLDVFVRCLAAVVRRRTHWPFRNAIRSACPGRDEGVAGQCQQS